MLRLLAKVVLNQRRSSSKKTSGTTKKAMALFAGNLKEFLTIKVKPRNDDYSDQVSRLVVTKIFVICTLLTCLDWFHDTFNCLPPIATSSMEMTSPIELPKEYLASVCWINGIYLYPELSSHMDQSSFYGVPNSLDNDGLLEISPGHVSGGVCQTSPKFSGKPNKHCRKMEKLYFTQYQWMPFLVGTLGIFFYVPYMLFRIINTDMVSLRNAIRPDKIEVEEIVKNFFNRDINSPLKMRCRVALNFIIKLCYCLVNYGTFKILNAVLNGNFFNYGADWAAWVSKNTTRMDFLSRRVPTPGNMLLPTFGMCDIHDTRNGLTRNYANRYTIVCEISSHLLYQYMFVIMWFLLVLSICISIFGVFLHIGGHLRIVLLVRRQKLVAPIAHHLMHREIEYLEFLRRRDLTTYGKVLRRLQTFKKCNDMSSSNGGAGDLLRSLEMEYNELTVSDRNNNTNNSEDSGLNESIT